MSSTGISGFFRMRSHPDRTRLFPALGSRVHSPPSRTRHPAALANQQNPAFTCTRLPTGAHGSAFNPSSPHMKTHLTASQKAQHSLRRHFSAHSSTSCMRHPRRRSSNLFEASLRRSSTHFEASLRRQQPLKRRISAQKFA